MDPKQKPPVDNEIANLVDGLIRNENQIEALRQAVSGDAVASEASAATDVKTGIEKLTLEHREAEARLQVLIAGVERRHQQ
jgi:hypothetical protein